MNKAMLVLVNADKDIPSKFLEKVLEDYPKPFGCACVQAEGEILWEQQAGGATLANIMQMLDHYKATNRLLIFGGAQDNEEDLQPYHLLSGEDDCPDIVGFLVGEFPAYHIKENTKSDAFIAMESVVVPTILQFAELCDNDVDKIMAAITKAKTASDFHAMFGASDGGPINGALAILGKNGQLKLFNEKAVFGADTDWGWTSKVYDTTEKTEEVPITKPKRGMLPSTPPASTTTVKKVGETTIIHSVAAPEPPKTATAAPKPSVAMVQVPTNLKNKDLRRWFNKTMGYTPTGWADMPGKTVEIPAHRNQQPEKKVIKDLRELNPEAIVGTAKPVEEEVVTDDTPTPPAEEEKPKETTPTPSVPIIPAAQVKDLREKFLKSPQIQEAMKGTPTLEAIYASEKVVPSFTAQTGIELIDTGNWPRTAYKALNKEYPQTLEELCINYRNELMKFLLKEAPVKGDEEIVEDDVEEAKAS